MVKELVMDNMYNSGLLSDSMKSADRFAFDSNEFQSIFDGKKDTQYMDYTESSFSFNKVEENINSHYSNNIHTADGRFNNKVSTNSTTISPANTKNKASVACKTNKVSGDTQNVESDGYSFSVRESLQNDNEVVNRGQNKEVQQAEAAEDTEITAADRGNTSVQSVKQEDTSDVTDEKTDNDSANLSGNNTMFDDTANEDIVDSDNEIINATSPTEKESMNDIHNLQTDVQNLVNDTNLLMYQTAQITANIGSAGLPEIPADSAQEIFDAVTVDEVNTEVLPEKGLESSSQAKPLQTANAHNIGQTINAKTEQITSGINTRLADDNADIELRLQIQPDVNDETAANRVKIDVLDYGLREPQNVEDTGTPAGINTVQNLEQANQQANTSGLLLNENEWQVLDEVGQYEFTGNLASNDTTELLDDVLQQGTDTEIIDSVETTDINQQTTDAQEVLQEKDLNIDNLDIKTPQQIQDVDIDAEIQNTVSPVKISNVIKNETANSVSIQDDGVETGAAARPVETKGQFEQNNSEVANVSEMDITDSSDLITDDVEKSDVNTQKQLDTNLKIITPDEQADTDLDVNVKAESKNNDLYKSEMDDKAVTKSVIEPEVDNTGSENSNGTNSDSTNPDNANTDSTASDGQTDDARQSLFKKNAKEDDIDMNLQERTRLVYVDMTDTSSSTGDDVIAQLESKFDSEIYSSEYNNDETISVQSEDLTSYTDIDVEAADTNIKVTSLEDIVDEKMADELNITLKESVSSPKDGYSSTNSTTEQLIRYAIEGDTGFDTKLTSNIRQEVQSQITGNTNSASKEVLAQINEKLTSFNFRPGAKLTMQLNPEELGTVEIKLTNTLDGIKAEMTASSDDAGNMLNKHIDELKDTLQKYGVRLDKVAVSTTPPQQSGTQQDYTEQDGSQKQQQEPKQQHKEERGTKNFEDMVNSFYEEVNKE